MFCKAMAVCGIKALSGCSMAKPISYPRISEVFSVAKAPSLRRKVLPLSVTSRYMTTIAQREREAPEVRPRRVFADHVFYKGKCAMNMRLTKPQFKINDTGDAVLAKEGTIMLEFAPCVSARNYDWTKKQMFALSVMELGQMLALTPVESLEFFHDPYMGKSDAGMVRKSLKIEPTADKSGWFFSLNVMNKVEKAESRLSLPISKGEFAIIRSAANYALPFLMGWHHSTEYNRFDDASLSVPGFSNNAVPRSLVKPPPPEDAEWSR